MYGPDIDITVAYPNPREMAEKFLAEIIKFKKFRKYEFGDFETFPLGNRPNSVIVVLILPYGERVWEIEIWFFKEQRVDQIEFEERLKGISDETRMKILTMKHEREVAGTTKYQLSSFEIYMKYL